MHLFSLNGWTLSLSYCNDPYIEEFTRHLGISALPKFFGPSSNLKWIYNRCFFFTAHYSITNLSKPNTISLAKSTNILIDRFFFNFQQNIAKIYQILFFFSLQKKISWSDMSSTLLNKSAQGKVYL